jgi:outer membrane protein OmpA-like peptidoglycan-associated protein
MLLGYSRALAVAQVLVAKGVRWEQIRIVSCGDNERRVARIYDDPDADRENQRVNIVPTSDPVPDYSPAEAKAPESKE